MECISYISSLIIRDGVSIHQFEIGTIFVVRKSKDYVYGIWVYKALDIWKGYYRVKKSLERETVNRGKK